MLFKNVKVVFEDEILKREVLVEGGKIAAVAEKIDAPAGTGLIDGKGRFLSPGFIDLHVHGGGGHSAMGTPEDVKKMAEAHAGYGTTSLLPTTLAAPLERLKSAIDSVREAQKATKDANILGVHLEGPFLSPEMCGAQSRRKLLIPAEHDYEELLSYWDGIKIMGAAPETEGGMALGEALRKRGIVASIAHSAGDYDTALEALRHGYTDVTHLYNACTSCHKAGAFRYAGTVEAALTHDEFTVQVIADLRHLPEGVLRLIYRCKGDEKMYLVTDGLEYSALELEEGAAFTQENGIPVVYEDGVMKLADRSRLAGSTATMQRLVRNMVRAAGVPLCSAVKMAAATPARVIGLGGHKGRIAPGFDADLILFDGDINVSFVMTGGKRLSPAGADEQ